MNKCRKTKSFIALALLIIVGVTTLYKKAVDKEVERRMGMFKPWQGIKGMKDMYPFKGTPPLAGMTSGMGMGGWRSPFAPHYGTLDMGAFRNNR